MYRVLLVDDDVEILEFLSHLIEWEAYNMQICAKKRNGLEAIDFLKETPVDILVTDITMPGLSGLDLVEEARLYCRELKSIILTCHEDFQYARRAVELGVCAYLVKYTLEAEILLEALRDVISKIEEERKKKETLTAVCVEMKKNKGALIEKGLNELLQGGQLIPSELEKLKERLEISGKQKVVTLYIRDMEVKTDEFAIREKPILLYAIQNIADEILENMQVSHPYLCGNRFFAIFVDKAVEPNELEKRLQMVVAEVKRLLSVELTIVVSMGNNRLEEFQEVAERLEKKRVLHFYPDDRAVILEETGIESRDIKKPETTKLYETIATGDFDGIQYELEQIFKGFLENHTQAKQVEVFYQLFEREMGGYLYRMGVKKSWEGKCAESWSGYYKHAKALAQWAADICEFQENTEVREEIRQVTEYMKQHLGEKLSCEAMARMVNMNTSYFSKLFKKEQGESFSEYLNRIRIERATMLLKNSDLSIEEITERVGLSDIHYFYRMYKKNTGMLPGNIRSKR